MASQKQIEANRRNAAKSKGPRTADGKVRSSMNALRHGFAADRWRQELARLEQAEGLSVEQQYILLAQKAWEIERMKWKHLGDAEKSKTDPSAVVRNLKRAAALDRYGVRVDAAKRRMLRKNLTDS